MKKSVISRCVALGLMSLFGANAATSPKELPKNVEHKVIK
jgi:hypothetical protein